MFCKALMSETMSFDRLRSSMWADLQGPVNINMYQIILYSLNNVKTKYIHYNYNNFTGFCNLTSMKADIGCPSFHSWQSGDEVDKHLASCALLSYLVDFIYGWIPKNEQQNLIWQNYTMVHTQQRGKCWTYFADAIRLALWEASSKSLWMMRILLQGPVLPPPFLSVRKFLQENSSLDWDHTSRSLELSIFLLIIIQCFSGLTDTLKLLPSVKW